MEAAMHCNLRPSDVMPVVVFVLRMHTATSQFPIKILTSTLDSAAPISLKKAIITWRWFSTQITRPSERDFQRNRAMRDWIIDLVNYCRHYVTSWSWPLTLDLKHLQKIGCHVIKHCTESVAELLKI